MTLYLDSSAIVKIYVDEADSDEVVEEVSQATTVVTSVLAYAEVRAAFARRRRDKSITAEGLEIAKKAFDADWSSWVVIGLDAELARQAGSHADVHGLRGADAVHLASFEYVLISCEDEDLRFRCADERLTRAALDLGERM